MENFVLLPVAAITAITIELTFFAIIGKDELITKRGFYDT